MTEVLFYHLEHQPLERVLPSLVERTLERGWRAVVQAGSEERVEALDTLLWTYREESFLPHGTKRDGNAAAAAHLPDDARGQPNGATVRFLVDGAETADLTAYARIVYLFEGRDAAAVARAREQWKVPKRPAATSPTGSSRPRAAGRRRRDPIGSVRPPMTSEVAVSLRPRALPGPLSHPSWPLSPILNRSIGGAMPPVPRPRSTPGHQQRASVCRIVESERAGRARKPWR